MEHDSTSPHSGFEEKKTRKKTPFLKKENRISGKKALFFFTILFPLISMLLTFITIDIRNYE